MVKQEMRDRRRSTRNKTIVINFKQEVEDLPNKNINVSEPKGIISSDKFMQTNLKDLQQRSFNFDELISAFKNIEKRSNDSDYAIDTLKRFKCDEENYQMNPYLQEKMKIEREIFPKISENIFFKQNSNKNSDFWNDR